MGQDHGKNIESRRDDYFQEQLQLYRWRADPTKNLHLARVHFTSKNRLLGRNKLHNILQHQLSTQNYVDVEEISSLAKEQIWKEAEEVMTFESYYTTLKNLNDSLNFQEMVYVLQVMLSGFETIYHKFSKIHISSECCFLTQKGELRIWINPNPTSNQFPENISCLVGEPSSVNQLLRICKELTFDRAAFVQFHRELSSYLDRDLLHNTGFSSLRRFVNGYVYSHKIIVPQNIEKTMKKIKSELISQGSTLKNSPISTPKHRHSSSLSQIGQSDWDSRVRMLSTGANLVNGNNTSVESINSSKVSHAESRQFQFYRPNQKYEQKLSSFDLNRCQQAENSLKGSSKKSGKMSLSSSFSKKNKPQYSQLYVNATPKNNCRTRTGLESTSGESFLYHSKDPSGFTGSKLTPSNSTSNFLQCRQPVVRFEKKQSRYFQEDIQKNRLRSYLLEHQHSRQPSFDQNSSSLFVSPASELQNESSQPYKQPDLSKIEAVPEAEASEDGSVRPSLSTQGRITPSQLLTRQVSGLIENQQINMFQSRGSFLSIDNSNASDYKGILNGLCRSAKMLNIVTRKQIQRRNSRRPSKTLHIN